MNLVLINKEEALQGIPIKDPRAIHLTQTVGLILNKTFFVGIKNELRGLATITQINEHLVFSVHWEKEKQLKLPLELLVGLPRPQTAKKILYSAASLGIKKVNFFISEKGDPGYLSSSLWKNQEWEDYVLRGAEQACSCLVPEILHTPSLEECLKSTSTSGWRVVLDPYTSESSLSSNKQNESAGILAIGPERGWSDSERSLLKKFGFFSHNLGDRILRVEDACLAGSAIMLSQLNAWQTHRPLF